MHATMIPVTEFHIVLIASLFSTLGWVIGGAGLIYVPYLVIMGGNWRLGITVMVAAIVLGGLCAKIEHRYSRIDTSR